MPQRRFHTLALLDLRQQLTIGRCKLFRALLQPRLELVVQPAALVLPSPPTQCRLHNAHQRGGMKRPFKKCDIAKDPGQRDSRGIPLKSTTVAGQHHEGKIRPRRLGVHPFSQRARVDVGNRLLRQNSNVRAGPELIQQVPKLWANIRIDSCLNENLRRNAGVTPMRRQDQGAFGWDDFLAHVSPTAAIAWPTKVGTPRRTPWNSLRGCPSLRPSVEIVSSRMVSSCAPVRFCTAEIARRTRPKASK